MNSIPLLVFIFFGTSIRFDVQKHYLLWRIARAKSQSKVLRTATLEGDLNAIQGFTTWCFINKIRKAKLVNIKKILSKKMRRQRTSRVGLDKEQSVVLAVKALMEVVDSGEGNLEVVVMRSGRELEKLSDEELKLLTEAIQKEKEEAEERRKQEAAS